ncbi:IS6 family transposase [Streptomyces sp. GD-15H]
MGTTGGCRLPVAGARGSAPWAVPDGLCVRGGDRAAALRRVLSRWLTGWDDLRVGHDGGGPPVDSAPSYRGHRYPVEVISHCVWLYFRFPLSFREVEELMLERGVLVSYETVRRWCAKFGQAYADALRRRQPRPGDKWHLDEVFIKINGEQKYLWRAVDADGTVLDILVQNRRDTAAARRFFRTLLKKTCSVPRVVITDKLRSYGAAHREVMPSVEHRSHKGLNHRAEHSHQPTRQRERAMKGFRSVGACKESTRCFAVSGALVWYAHTE